MYEKSCRVSGSIGIRIIMIRCIQDGTEISVIIVTKDYLCYKDATVITTFFLILTCNELFKFKTSDE